MEIKKSMEEFATALGKEYQRMTSPTGIRDVAHCQVQLTARSPGGEVVDVRTVMFVMIHTSVEIPGWVVTGLVTALKIHFSMRTIRKARDAAHHQVQVTAMSPRREMCDVTRAMFTTKMTSLAMKNARRENCVRVT